MTAAMTPGTRVLVEAVVETVGAQGCVSVTVGDLTKQVVVLRQEAVHAPMSDAEVLRKALEEIVDAHVPSQPMTSDDDELTWAHKHVGKLRGIALAAIRAVAAPKPTLLYAAKLSADAMEGLLSAAIEIGGLPPNFGQTKAARRELAALREAIAREEAAR